MNNFIVSKLFEYSRSKAGITAIQDGKESITYGQLWDRMWGYSEIIRRHSGGKHLPVIIYQERNIHFIVSMLACLSAGCFYIPVVKDTPTARIEDIIKDSKCRLALVDEEIPNASLKQLNVLTSQCINSAVEAAQADLWGQQGDLAYVMYTSGTTGSPKGVMIKLSNLQNLIDSFGEIIYNRVEGIVRVAVLASFGFDSSVKQIYCSLYYGHTLVIASERQKRFSKLLQQFYVDNDIFLSDGTPSNMRILLMTKKKIKNNVKYYVIGGEIFRAEIAKAMFEAHENPIELINVYGPTECCVDVSYYRVKKEDCGEGYIPIGIPLLNTRLRIMDEMGNEVNALGEKGELVVYGKQVGGGYTNGKNHKFTFGKEIFDNSYRTGDIAALDGKGQIVVLGRSDNQIKKYGYRIELDEISVQIKRLKSITDVAVRKKNLDGIEKIVAYYISEQTMEEEALLREIGNIIPYYMIPDFMVQIAEMPINRNGKVDENKLAECFEGYKVQKALMRRNSAGSE